MCIALLCYSLVPLGRHGSDRQDMAVLLIDPLHITESMWCVFSLDQYSKQKRSLLCINWLLMFHWRVLILLWKPAVLLDD